MKKLKIAVTGAAGNIDYAILFRLASGDIFGPDTAIDLHLLEITPAMKALEGVKMELEDSAFPLLENIVITDEAKKAFNGVNWALLVGSRPRGKGMKRGDLIKVNGPIFVEQGQALNNAADDVRVLVVGNPANTNALIAYHNAPDIPRERFAAMTQLDHNRAINQLANKAGCFAREVSNVTIWGNHSATQFPDAYHARIRGLPAATVIKDKEWLRGEFITTVQKRGAEIINARGASSAASAADAALDHVKNMSRPTPAGDWFSCAVPSDGSYDIDDGLMFSFPIIADGYGNYEIVQGLRHGDFAKEKIRITLDELRHEKSLVADLLK